MRLKFLFFPVMIIISLSLFIGYVWPEITDLRMANDQKIVNQQALQDINNKKAAVDKVGSQITDDAAGTSFVNNYLPNTKVEERILSGINFLASDSSVGLINVSLKDAVNASNAPSTQLQGFGLVSPASVDVNAVQTTATSQSATQAAADSLQFTEATLSISGNYDDIRLFIDQLQRMTILNSIRSVTISSSSSDDDSNAKVDPSILSAVVIVDFGYLDPVKIDARKVANFKPDMDSDTMKVLQQYVSQKAPDANSGGDSNGKTNPFLP